MKRFPSLGKFLPTPRLALLILGLGVATLLPHWVVWAGYALAGSWLITDFWRLTRPFRWEAIRTVDPVLTVGTTHFVTISVAGPPGSRLWIGDHPPSEWGDPVSHEVTTPSGRAQFQYAILPPERGAYVFGSLSIRWRTPLGLVAKQDSYPLSTPIKVYPALRHLGRYRLAFQRGQRLEAGAVRWRLPGIGTTVESLRAYTADDDSRWVDWKASARMPTLISRQYEVERDQPILLMIDCGRVMRDRLDHLRRLDHALEAALLLGYVAAHHGDKVGLLAYGPAGVIRYLPPRGSPRQIYRLVDFAYGLSAEPGESRLERALGFLQTTHRKRALVLLLTDFSSRSHLERSLPMLRLLSRRHHALVTAVRDPGLDRLAHSPVSSPLDLLKQRAALDLLEERKRFISSLREQGADAMDLTPHALTPAVITRYLDLKRRLTI